jgi:hypothetical protein
VRVGAVDRVPGAKHPSVQLLYGPAHPTMLKGGSAALSRRPHA